MTYNKQLMAISITAVMTISMLGFGVSQAHAISENPTVKILGINTLSADSPNTYKVTLNVHSGKQDVSNVKIKIVSDKATKTVNVHGIQAYASSLSTAIIEAREKGSISASVVEFTKRSEFRTNIGIAPGKPAISEEETITTTQQRPQPVLRTVESPPMFLTLDIGKPFMYLINTETDALIKIDLSKDPSYPGGAPLHSFLSKSGEKALVTLMSSKENPATILVIDISNVNWTAKSADIKISNVIKIAEAGEKPSILIPEGTKDQPITSLWKPGNHQIHGPSKVPGTDLVYLGQWTDNKIRVVNLETEDLAAIDPIQLSTITSQLHGAFTSPDGTKALGATYYYDKHAMPLFNVNADGSLDFDTVIPLQGKEPKEYGAFTHFARWIDNRYAVTGPMQIGPTSLTPSGFDIVGPSIFLIDTKTKSAQMIIGPKTPAQHGIANPPSDYAIVGDKLYVGEEDSLDREFNKEGAVSIWDISDVQNPRFIKRIDSTNGLPHDITFAHGLFPTPDGGHLYILDFESGNIVKLDAQNDKVVKRYGKQDGMVSPHGGFMAGSQN